MYAGDIRREPQENMGEIERIQTFVTDIDELLKIRDTHMRQLRAMKVEADILNRYSLDKQFDQEREKYLADQKALRAQIDEYMRGTDRTLFLLTGKRTIDEVRILATQLKVALSKISETAARYAEAQEDAKLYEDTDNTELRDALIKDLEVSEQVFNRSKEYANSLVPASYSPNESIL